MLCAEDSMRSMAVLRLVRIAVVSGAVTALTGGPVGCSKGPPAGPDTRTTGTTTTPPPAPDAAAPATTPTVDAGAGAATTPEADAATAPDAASAACESAEVAAALKELKPDFAAVTTRGLEVCGGLGEEKRGCVIVDLTTDKRTFAALPADDADHLPPWPEHFDDGLVRDDKRPVLKLCASAADGCKDLYVGAVTTAHLSDDRAHAVLTAVGSDPAKSARVFDTKTLEARAVIPMPESELVDCSFAAFAGPSVVVAVGPCTPGGGAPKAWLAKADSGEKIADIGPKDRPGIALREGQWTALPEVGPNIVAFRAAEGTLVVLQDVVTGEVKSTVAIAVEGARDVKAPAWIFATKSGFVMVESLPLPTTLTRVALSGDAAKFDTRAPVLCP
jgi:hypothetical protein